MKTTRILLAILAIASLSGSALRAASLTNVAWYKLGEDDPGAVANTTGQNPTQDSSANNLDLTRTGSPTYRADADGQAFGSTLSMEFNGSSDRYSGAVVPTSTTGVGLEAWVKADTASPATWSVIAHNGRTEGISGAGTDNGYGIVQGADGNWYAHRSSFALDNMGPVTVGAWTHLALTIDGSGRMRGWVNGTPTVIVGSASTFTPTTNFQLGGPANAFATYFDGRIDQTRVFTFLGTFSPVDFLIGDPSHITAYRTSFEPGEANYSFTGSAGDGVVPDPTYNGQSTDGTQFFRMNSGSLFPAAVITSTAFATPSNTPGTLMFDFGAWGAGESQSIRLEIARRQQQQRLFHHPGQRHDVCQWRV